MYLDELAADLDGQRSDGPPALPSEQVRADPRPLVDEPAQDAPASAEKGSEGSTARPDWLNFKIKETQFGDDTAA